MPLSLALVEPVPNSTAAVLVTGLAEPNIIAAAQAHAENAESRSHKPEVMGWLRQATRSDYLKCCGENFPGIIACQHAMRLNCTGLIASRSIKGIVSCPACRAIMLDIPLDIPLDDLGMLCVRCAVRLLTDAVTIGMPVWIEHEDGQCESMNEIETQL